MEIQKCSIIIVLPMYYQVVHCEACFGGMQNLKAMFFMSIPTIKYYLCSYITQKGITKKKRTFSH